VYGAKTNLHIPRCNLQGKYFGIYCKPTDVVHKAKGENLQRSLDGPLSNNLRHEVHGFANLDNGLV